MIPDADETGAGYVVRVSITAPDTRCPVVLPFRLNPEQMKGAQVSFEAIRICSTRTDEGDLKRDVYDHEQTYRLKDLIGQGVSRELCGICQSAKEMNNGKNGKK